ncbi:hypothetical protein PR202_ga21152 [Eleusine coracana subsp. coracana]|uniref:Uncharacterized protein n=1 Tax=Eleusine coracana subsp. coracana TaxID=191504 RepID=A0AAV5D049_ELECO|nr:hypothetical protein PR202_ga21152 [Eleusine coracana subsp. coracana]
MGLLDQLWDETVAGPRPDFGLGKLRKYSSFSPSSTSAWSSSAPAAAATNNDPPPPAAVTRSITIARPPALTVDASPRGESYSSSVPDSPASTPDSPFGSGATLRSISSSSLTPLFIWIENLSLFFGLYGTGRWLIGDWIPTRTCLGFPMKSFTTSNKHSFNEMGMKKKNLLLLLCCHFRHALRLVEWDAVTDL